MNSSWRNNFGHNIFNKSQQASIQVDGRQLKAIQSPIYQLASCRRLSHDFALKRSARLRTEQTGDDSIEPFSYT